MCCGLVHDRSTGQVRNDSGHRAGPIGGHEDCGIGHLGQGGEASKWGKALWSVPGNFVLDSAIPSNVLGNTIDEFVKIEWLEQAVVNAFH
jgi:hypothetical protein